VSKLDAVYLEELEQMRDYGSSDHIVVVARKREYDITCSIKPGNKILKLRDHCCNGFNMGACVSLSLTFISTFSTIPQRSF